MVRSMTLARIEEVRAIWTDPWSFISRLVIKDRFNRLHRLDQPWGEQVPWIDALLSDKKYVLGLKPRQVGYTTWTTAYLFWLSYTSTDPRLALQVCHDPDANLRLRDMVDTFRENLPRALRRPYKKGRDNENNSQYGHNGAGFIRRIAGARGKARGWTSNDLHATEMAHWASATSASSRTDAGGSDEQMFSSAMATMHDPTGRVIVESTGNGPTGLFHDLWKQATTDPKWAYVFVPWNTVGRYKIELTDREARDLERDLDDDEKVLVQKFGLSMPQIAWRRNKMRTERWTRLMFRREYPLVDTEPFMLAESNWFDQEVLSVMLSWVPPLGREKEPYREFYPPMKGVPYFMGVDTSGGVGEDWAVIQVIDINLRHMATWSSNRASPHETADQVSRMGARWGRPLTVIERNHHGKVVIDRVAELGGVALWKTDDDRDFWSSGSGAGESKRKAMSHARSIIDDEQTTIADARTIHELQTMVEKSDGKIEASGSGHDDHAYAFVMALWAAKDQQRLDKAVHERDRDRIERIRAMRRTSEGRR